jgi:peptide deformylase
MHKQIIEDAKIFYEITRKIPELTYAGDAILRTVAQDVMLEDFANGMVERTAKKMKDVLVRFNKITGGGVGIAANQIGISSKIIVLRPKLDDQFEMLVNPRIVEFSNEKVVYSELCMSLGTIITGDIIRSASVTVEYYSELNRKRRRTFKGKMAVLLQHEIGHLYGELCTDHAAPNTLKLAGVNANRGAKVKYLKQDETNNS